MYDGLAGAYLAEGKVDWAAISMVEKAQMDGARPATLSALRAIYARIPEGACSVTEGGVEIDLECPRLRSDLCTAWVDLAQAFAEARQTAASGDSDRERRRSGAGRRKSGSRGTRADGGVRPTMICSR